MAIRVDICVCTFRRPAVAETLRSLAQQQLPPGVVVRVIVADNDETPSARSVVEAAAGNLDLHYVHAPARNISIARNAGLDAARAPWIAFIDDDETASPHWLAELLAEAERGGWDAVLGPVLAVYDAAAPAWMAAGDFHSTRPVRQGDGRIVKGYAGNVLIRRAALEALNLRFDPALGRQGGEDDDLFLRLTDGGGCIGYAPRAVAQEPVPATRASLSWLLRRSFRTGQTHGGRLLAAGRPRRPAALALAGGKAAVCLAGAVVALPFPTRRMKWLVRGALHAGVVSRLAGRRVLELY